ncbi:MAG: heavy-metal-associated domain-containing protein [Solirubrobacteraceae bacterium]
MTQSRVAVPDVVCDRCKAAVESAVRALPGIRSVRVDLRGKLVTVEHDVRTPLAAIAEAIAAEGYAIGGSGGAA